MPVSYRFDEDSYQRIGAAGVGWQATQEALEAQPQYRQNIGAALRIAGRDRHGRWIGVTLIEEGDDAYLVITARWLDEAEQAQMNRLWGGTS